MKIIDNITIRYYRSIYSLDLNNCQDMTVLTGKNDVGKSNVLKALNLFFSQQSDYLQDFDFTSDYSLLRKEEVKKDTIRGQQFISISIRFVRGERMPNSLPPEFTVTKRWDMHSQTPKMSTNVQIRMQWFAKKNNIRYSEKTTTTSLSAFLNKIRYIYIPAIKDDRVFRNTLNILQQNLFSSKNKAVLDAPISTANEAIQKIISDLQVDFEKATEIKNLVELPSTLNYTNGLLQISTETEGGAVSIEKRGDGIRTHFIPKILNYVAEHSSDILLWGFEEPENSYEYRRCMQVANEFCTQYSRNSQIFITSHSPAFLMEDENKIIHRLCLIQGKTTLINDNSSLADELGYIELYKDFIEKAKKLQENNDEKETIINTLRDEINAIKTPIILTEGKTDASLLHLAISKLNLVDYSNWVIKPIESKGTSNNDTLIEFLENLKKNASLAMPVIGMFDRDTKISMTDDDLNTFDIRDKQYCRIAPQIYAFAIPAPHNRPETDQISIEHYFTDKEIKTELEGKRLFLGNEFYSTGVYKGDEELFYKNARNVSDTIKIIEHETRAYVTKADASGDYSLSKARFVESIEKNKVGFSDFSFNEFYKIFEILSLILRDSSECTPTT